MQKNKKNIRVIISGGGTGGHIFPALSIAEALQQIAEAEILFVGAEGRMEMEKVPQAGYPIKGLPVKGFSRSKIWKNFSVLAKLLKSLGMARSIIKDFHPDVVVGVGGYASGPVLWQANRMNIPTLIQEQNSYAGVTNKLLARKAHKICVAYDEMERYFPSKKIENLGNPIRPAVMQVTNMDASTASKHWDLESNKKTVLLVGGSLGAGTLNRCLEAHIDSLNEQTEVQWIWQCGKYYYDNLNERIGDKLGSHIKLMPFISEMNMAYAAADVIISRAGAGTLSELSLVGKPVVLVPSPNVAEDHQTKNAMSLVKANAAVYVADSKAQTDLLPAIYQLLENQAECESLASAIKKLAKPNAASDIANRVLRLIK